MKDMLILITYGYLSILPHREYNYKISVNVDSSCNMPDNQLSLCPQTTFNSKGTGFSTIIEAKHSYTSLHFLVHFLFSEFLFEFSLMCDDLISCYRFRK